MSIRLKVLAASSNCNSFGLRGMVLIGDNGQGWEAAANDINLRTKGTILRVPDKGDIGLHLSQFGFEIAKRLHPDPPAEVVREVFGLKLESCPQEHD